LKTLIIGVGNEFCGDDAIGIKIAKLLTDDETVKSKVMVSSGDGMELLNIWQGYDFVLIVDAIQGNAGVGTIHCWDIDLEAIPSSIHSESTHSFGVFEGIELARELKLLPKQLFILGIEAGNCEVGREMSSQIKSVIPVILRLIKSKLLTQSVSLTV
jgi:hydrogenase maturation protease